MISQSLRAHETVIHDHNKTRFRYVSTSNNPEFWSVISIQKWDLEMLPLSTEVTFKCKKSILKKEWTV